MLIAIDGYELRCHHCQITRKEAEFDLGMQYLWANQHGHKIRLFCHRCGHVHDVTIRDGGHEVTPCSMKCAVYDRLFVEAWNTAHPVGTLVKVTSADGGFEARTRNEAWANPSGTVLVLLQGHAGGWDVRFLEKSEAGNEQV